MASLQPPDLDGPRRVPRAVSEFPEIHVSVAILSGIMPMFCGRSGIRTRDVLRFLRRLYVALSVLAAYSK